MGIPLPNNSQAILNDDQTVFYGLVSDGGGGQWIAACADHGLGILKTGDRIRVFDTAEAAADVLAKHHRGEHL